MSFNNFNTNFNYQNYDLANLVSSWGANSATPTGSRIMPYYSSGSTFYVQGVTDYFFPAGWNGPTGYEITINGQIITISNVSGSNITIHTGSTQIYTNGTYYPSNSSFTLSNNQGRTFVLLWGNYWIEIAGYNI